VQQIAMADVLVLNKRDLVGQGDLEALLPRLAAINGLAPVQATSRGVVELGQVLGLKGFDLETVEDKVCWAWSWRGGGCKHAQ
jgi:G3E family GTPase